MSIALAATRWSRLPSAVSDNIDRYWNPTWKAYGTVDGTLYGAPWDANSKSLVWYSPKRFKAAGYSVPRTWDELMSLSDRIARGGTAKPWCGGLESGPRHRVASHGLARGDRARHLRWRRL